MKRKLCSLILTLALTLSILPQSYAYDASVMTDIANHWGKEYITWSMEQNLFLGTSDTEFSPDGFMTRGMFMTVLGRMAGIDSVAYDDWYLDTLYQDVDPNLYYAPYINWATRLGIAKGMGEGKFMPEEWVTREQIAAFLVRYASIYHYNLTTVTDLVVDGFADGAKVSSYAVDAVEAMRVTGIVIGRDNGNGTYYFAPTENTTRAETATILYRLSSALQQNEDDVPILPDGISLQPESVTLYPGEKTSLVYEISPQDVSNPNITWVSENPAIAKVNETGTVTAVSEGTVEIYAYTWNGYFSSTTVTCEKRSSLSSDSESYAEKSMRLFGEVVDSKGYAYRSYYKTYEEAASHMVPVTIKAWDFADTTQTTKITRQFTIYVHENIADTVLAIFDEIYNGEEQFPIHDVGGFRFELGSEHSIGVAIDINANENYYINHRTGQTIGSYWKPGEDPYSIPTDGEVAQIFQKYGFRQGRWSYIDDYMHFSYFGT